MTVKRVWALTGEVKVEIDGVVDDINVQLFPTGQGFIVIVQLPIAWRSYYIDAINELPIAIRQAIIDLRKMNGSNKDVNIRVIESKIGNTYIGYKNMVRDGLINEIEPLNDIYVE